MPAVWAGVNFSSPGTGTPCNLPSNSICGGRPGEKIRSLTLSETASIVLSTSRKFIGAPVVCVFGVCGVLIRRFVQWTTFREACDEIATPSANQRATCGVHLSVGKARGTPQVFMKLCAAVGRQRGKEALARWRHTETRFGCSRRLK